MPLVSFRRPARPGRARLPRTVLAALLLAACGDGGTGPGKNPAPTVTTLNPVAVAAGSPGFILTVNGTGFVAGSIVRWNGLPRPTTFVSATRLNAEITSADVAQGGTADVKVTSPPPGGGTSNAVDIEVSDMPPAILTGMQPDTLHAGVGGTVTVVGTGFVPGSRVQLSGTFMPATTVVSSTQVQFTLSAQNVATGGLFPLVVLNPVGVPSNTLTLAVKNPVPTVSSISPSQAVAEQPDSVVVRVTGTNFVSGSVGYFRGMPRNTRRISATEVDVVLRAEDLVTAGTQPLVIVNHSPGGGGASAPFHVVNPAPAITAVTPAQAQASLDSLVVRLTVTGLVASTAVRVDGTNLVWRRLSRTELEAIIPAEHLDTPGTLSITAVNEAPGGGTSALVALPLAAPQPAITSIPSNGASAGGGGFPLTVHGTGFVRTSVVRWNGAERATRWISPTRLEMDVAAGDVATPRTATVTVGTPGGGTSNAVQVAVRTPGAATINSLRTLELPARGLVWDEGRGRLYASVGATGGERANTVVAIDPATGGITGSVTVGGDPGALAISDDGSTLWVALDGARDVLRLALPSLTPGTRFPTPHLVEDMQVMPGHPGTVVLSLRNSCCSPQHEGVVVYDDGVRRARSTDRHTGANRFVFGESAAVVYGYGNEGSPAYFFTLGIQADGAVKTRESTDVLSGANGHIRFGGGRVYSTLGIVADAARHEQLKYLPEAWAQTSVAVDVALGRVFYVDTDRYGHALQVFDINTFERLGTGSLNGLWSDHGFTAPETLLRWGGDGLALADGYHVHIFRTPLAGP